jgi:sialidase-1
MTRISLGQPVLNWRLLAAHLPMLLFACSSSSPAEPSSRCDADYPLVDPLEETKIFQGNADGYPVFRIPAAVTTESGVIVAFAEGRQTLEDPGAGLIDIVMKRSLDCGRTWVDFQVLAENGGGDAHNPTAVVAPDDQDNSLVWLFYGLRPASAGGEFDLPSGLGGDSARIFFRTSADDGLTWSEPREITEEVKDPSWAVTSTGPGQAIVTQWGNDFAPAGRILVPGWYHLEGETGPEGSFVFYSDDGGITWARGGLPEPISNEAQLVELTDGTILLDGRQNDGEESEVRYVFRSEDGGQGWGDAEGGLPMTPVMAGIERLSAVRSGEARDLLIHTGLAPDARFDVRVWLSDDEATTWTNETVVNPGFAQYSLVTILDDRTIGLVYESVESEPPTPGTNIRFSRFDLAWLHGD